MTSAQQDMIEEVAQRVHSVVIGSNRTRPYAYVSVLDANHPSGNGLGIADSNEAGYIPVPASILRAAPKDAGPEFFDAVADRINAMLGHDADTAFRIVASTMGGRYFDGGE